MKKLLSAIILATGFAVYASAADYHIAPDGNDANPGTAGKPFATFEKARDAARSQPSNTVHVHAGTYYLDKTLELTAADNGLTFRAFEKDSPIISGGTELKNWRLHNPQNNIYSATVSKAAAAGFRQLYIDGKSAVRARTPNRTSETTFEPYWRLAVKGKLTETTCLLTPEQWDACKDAERLVEVELVMNAHWYHQRIQIGSHQTTDKGTVIHPLHPKNKFTKGSGFYGKTFFFFENSLAFVDAPGEWYYDAKTATVYLAVTAGTDPNIMTITVPRLETLVTIRGTADKPAENLAFEGLIFECSNWTSPSRLGINATQFVQPIPQSHDHRWDTSDYPPGIIRAEHARKIAIRNNELRNTGATGIQFVMNVDDSDIEGNRIYQIAANGIEIDLHAMKNPPPEKQSSGVAVWNNHISKAGQDYTNGGALLAHNVRGLIVEHNLIHDMPYSGMQIGNQPSAGSGVGPVTGYRDVGCGDNRIRFNHVHHCMQLHDDGGGIYTLGGIQNGSVIQENFVHDITRGKWAGDWPVDSIYLDNCTSKITVTDNVVGKGRASQNNRSRDNPMKNNLPSNPEIEKNAGIKPGYSPRLPLKAS